MTEEKIEMLKVSAILFKNNVPIEEAKIIGAFIEELVSKNEFLIKRENKLQYIEQMFINKNVDLDLLTKIVMEDK